MNYKETPIGIMPETWEIAKISEVTDIVTDYVANGSFASLAANVKYLDKEDYAVLIRLADYNNNFDGNFVFIDEHAYNFLSKSKLFGNEIIISNVGANVGTVFRCPKLKYKMSLAPNSIVVKFKENDDFYYQWLKSHYGQKMLKSIVTGSAQPKFNKTNFKEMIVPVPPLETQQKIAEVLSSIDDKIELNNSINKNLELQIKTLYDNSFNGNHNIINISDLIDVRDGTHDSPKPQEEGKKLITSKHLLKYGVDKSSANLISEEDYNKINERSIVSTNDILISMIGTVGIVSFIIENPVDFAVKNVGIYRTSLKPEYAYYVHCYLNSPETQNYIQSHLAGTTQKYISLSELRALEINVPDANELNNFNKIVKPLYENIIINTKETEQLTQLRDTLLPKLMNGEIDVDKVEV